jgi:hypothetical protein
MVCENGLVISTEQFNDVKMRHMGYTFEELQGQIKEMVELLPLTVESMNRMKAIELNEDQTKALAKKALSTRFTEEQVEAFKIDIDKLESLLLKILFCLFCLMERIVLRIIF